MREIKSSTFKAVVEHTQTFEYMDIGNGIAIYRNASSAIVTDKKSPKVFSGYQGEVHQGYAAYCSLADAEKMAAGKLKSITNLFPGEYLYLGDQAMLGIISKYFYGSKEQDELLKPYMDANPWDVASSRDVILVRFDPRDNSWMDVNGDFLPQGILYSYMNDNMHNGHYDLEKVLVALRKDERITFKDLDRRPYQPVTSDDRIMNIPYYNVDASHSQHLSFIYTPTAEDMVKINKWYRECKDKNKYWSRHKYMAIRELDLLGINQFKISKDAE